jgi:hypothetical protein
VHHRVTVGGSINLKWAVRISPFVVLQSGAPFDINAGSDLYGKAPGDALLKIRSRSRQLAVY